MDVMDVLRMNGGIGDSSYSNNSLLQRKVISMTIPITQGAITDVYCNISPTTLAIADLGCSSGPNTLLVVSELIKTADALTAKVKLQNSSLNFQIYLNDLPGNDFNTIFRSLPKFKEDLKKQTGPRSGQCFFTGVPGSFYDRLFPDKSLHFVHSSYSLQWLSRVPEGVENNKRNIYMSSTSPTSVLCAYYEQFQRDFSMFLKYRSEEVVTGGRMVLTILGRKSDDPSSKECCYIWELLAMALNDMVSEGLIEEENVDSFNIPMYNPSPTEVKVEVQKEGSFAIDHLEVSEVNWNTYENDFNSSQSALKKDEGGYHVAKYMRAVAEPLLVSHFGEAIIDDVFTTYAKLISDRMASERTKFINVTVSMIKKE